MYMITYKEDGTSPSSRRAWIEIATSVETLVTTLVALLAEGVDRNFWRRLRT